MGHLPFQELNFGRQMLESAVQCKEKETNNQRAGFAGAWFHGVKMRVFKHQEFWLDCLAKSNRHGLNYCNNNYIKRIIYSTTTTTTLCAPTRLHQRTGSITDKCYHPSRGKHLDQQTSALPYPSFPALCRQDTTYPWSNRLRSP